MGLFSLLKTTKNERISKNKIDYSELSQKLVDTVIYLLKDSGGGVRIEDAVATLGTIISERCIELAGDISIYDHNKIPGQRIFSDNINIVIFGDSASENIELFPADSVVGQMRDTLKSASIGLEHFPSMKTVLENFAAGTGKEEDWGRCPWTVPDDNKPSVLPLRVGFETRYIVDHIIQTVTNKNDRLKICIQSLC